ncbi:hypothetical protein U9M48_042174 [Paspalum notatum var. saurae]|uniref:Uncharacterized protein n=1 Tax=Paspalum notatum var. saurae TaxID=547442 RepID=A0AAQ3XE77_PASNO
MFPASASNLAPSARSFHTPPPTSRSPPLAFRSRSCCVTPPSSRRSHSRSCPRPPAASRRVATGLPLADASLPLPLLLRTAALFLFLVLCPSKLCFSVLPSCASDVGSVSRLPSAGPQPAARNRKVASSPSPGANHAKRLPQRATRQVAAGGPPAPVVHRTSPGCWPAPS